MKIESEKILIKNCVIQGDCREVLPLLKGCREFKTVILDPPYNRGDNFESFKDCQGEKRWMTLMENVLRSCRELMQMNGSVWICIDDHEVHYLKVLCDTIFGRHNFLANIVWQKSYSVGKTVSGISVAHDHILVYRNSDLFKFNHPLKDQNPRKFNFMDSTNGLRYRRRTLRKSGSNWRRADRPNLFFGIKAPDGKLVFPLRSNGDEGTWRWCETTYLARKGSSEVEWVKLGSGAWEIYTKQFQIQGASAPPSTWWEWEEVGHNSEAKVEAKSINPSNPFPTPKPTRLIKKIIELSSESGDWILDPFAGSGTTAVVAEEINRPWVLIEVGNHVENTLLPRLHSANLQFNRQIASDLQE